MKPLIQQLVELLESLKPVPGTPAQAVPDLLRAMAASAIQSDPSQAQIPPGDFDPVIVEAINAGAADAAALTAAQTTLAPRAVKHHRVSRGLDRMVRAGLAC